MTDLREPIPLCSCERVAEFAGRLDEFTPCDDCNHPDVVSGRLYAKAGRPWTDLTHEERRTFMSDLATVLEHTDGDLHVPDDIHAWFGLSYCSYLTINRSLLQSMPDEWQYAFVKLLDELHAHFPNIHEPRYTVSCRTDDGRFMKDPIPHYARGRTLIRPEDTYGARDDV